MTSAVPPFHRPPPRPSCLHPKRGGGHDTNRPSATFLERVLLMSLNVPMLSIPPPSSSMLLYMVLLMTVSVPSMALKIPPPPNVLPPWERRELLGLLSLIVVLISVIWPLSLKIPL